jgi:hypothetical protein
MSETVSSVVWPGQVYGRWVVLAFSRKEKVPGSSKWYWLCRCRCGTERAIYAASLRNGRSASCGCLKKEVQAKLKTKHGQHKSPTYSCWMSMISRCHNPKRAAFADYGGRGIIVCNRWRYSFDAFLEDLGERPSLSHSIGRMNNDGNYEPGNCRWETQSEQNRNKRNNHVIRHENESMTIAEWAERTGLSFSVISYRLREGWAVADALETTASKFNSLRYKDRGRVTKTLTMGGETMTIAAWSRRTGISTCTLAARKKSGWPDERSLTESVKYGPRPRRQGTGV